MGVKLGPILGNKTQNEDMQEQNPEEKYFDLRGSKGRLEKIAWQEASWFELLVTRF